MLRTTVYLDEEVALAIRQLAERQKRSQADIIRDALARYLTRGEREHRSPPPPGVGAFRSGRSDVSEKAESILWKAAKRRR